MDLEDIFGDSIKIKIFDFLFKNKDKKFTSKEIYNEFDSYKEVLSEILMEMEWSGMIKTEWNNEIQESNIYFNDNEITKSIVELVDKINNYEY